MMTKKQLKSEIEDLKIENRRLSIIVDTQRDSIKTLETRVGCLEEWFTHLNDFQESLVKQYKDFDMEAISKLYSYDDDTSN